MRDGGDGGEYDGCLVFSVVGWWAIHKFINNEIRSSGV